MSFYNEHDKDLNAVVIPLDEELDEIQDINIRNLRRRGLGIVALKVRGKSPVGNITIPPSIKEKMQTRAGKYTFPKAGEDELKSIGFVAKAITSVECLNVNFPDAKNGVQPHNTAVVTGKVGGCIGIWVLDLDVKPEKGIDGVAAFRKWCIEHDVPFPNTYTVRTGGGGLHIYFLMPADEDIHIDVGTNVDLGFSDEETGVDYRGHGGLVVAEGSIHENGNYYVVVNDADIVEADPKIVALVASKVSKARTSTTASMNNYTDLLDEKHVDYPPIHWERLQEYCGAAALYESQAAVMPQNPWALFAGIVVRAENGVALFHDISSVYPTYDFNQAQDIAERAQGPKGALLCETVARLEVIGEACKNCRFKGILK